MRFNVENINNVEFVAEFNGNSL